jgi:predicted esterase
MTEERTIAVGSHGRYLVATPAHAEPRTPSGTPVLAGFHGYAEDAELHLERLRLIPGSDRWLIVSIQGLHRFYRGRSRDVVASWMTRQNRDLVMADNLLYVAAVIEEVRREWAAGPPLVFAGFSQGVAMAFRAAALGRHPISGVIALGGDVPPELEKQSLARIPQALVGRGERDDWYTPQKCADDETRLRAAGTNVVMTTFDAGHEWTADFNRVAAAFLARLA